VAKLASGKHFGELALTTNKPRAATVKTITNTHLLVLTKADYQRILLRYEEANLNKFVSFLKGMPQFAHWTKNVLSRLTYYMPRQPYSRHQTVFREGEPASHVYVVV
jgi:CRP-like cAMP-binding protein